MSYGYQRNSGIRHLNTYAHALQHYEQVKPIRGRTPELRPLGHRGNTYYSIAKRYGTEIIECRLYKEAIVIFHPDGAVEINNAGYSSISTANFIDDVMRSNNIRASLKDHSIVVMDGRFTQRIPKDGALYLRTADQDGRNYHFVTLTADVVHKVDRKQANNVRGRYSELYKYIRGMAKLNDSHESKNFTDTYQELKDAGLADMDLSNPQYHHKDNASYPPKVEAFIKLIDNTDAGTKHNSYFLAFKLLARSFAKFSWETKAYTLNDKDAIRALDYMLFGIYRDEVLKPSEVMEVQRDMYAKYWDTGWEAYHATKGS